MNFKPLTAACLVLLTALAWGGPYSDLSKKLESATTNEQVRQAVEHSPLASTLDDPDSGFDIDGSVADFKDRVEMRARLEGASSEPSQDQAKTTATEIKRDRLFRSAEAGREENWLARALQNLKFKKEEQKQGTSISLGSGLTVLVWVLLGLIVLAFLSFAIWFFSSKITREKRERALLDDEEPLRTSDEWMAIGREAEGRGDLRDAVRAYYLAGLLRLDELSILRFERTETNWQHLRRLSRRPRGGEFDLVPLTRRYDEIWFGEQATDAQELTSFRSLAAHLEQVAKQA